MVEPDLNYTTLGSSSARTAVWPWIWGAVVLVGMGAFTVGISAGLPAEATIRFRMAIAEPITDVVMFGGELVGMRGKDGFLQSLSTGRQFDFPVHAVTDFMSYLPLLLVGVVWATVAAGRRIKSGMVTQIVLVVLAAGLVGVGLPVVSGLLQGMSAAVPVSEDKIGFVYRIAKDLSPMLICFLVVLSWVIARAAFIDEGRNATDARGAIVGRPLALWGAVGAGFGVVVVMGIMFAQSLVMRANAVTPLWQGRYLIQGLLALVGTVFLIVGLVRGRASRWAWVAFAAIVGVGGDASVGFAFVMAVLSGWRER